LTDTGRRRDGDKKESTGKKRGGGAAVLPRTKKKRGPRNKKKKAREAGLRAEGGTTRKKTRGPKRSQHGPKTAKVPVSSGKSKNPHGKMLHCDRERGIRKQSSRRVIGILTHVVRDSEKGATQKSAQWGKKRGGGKLPKGRFTTGKKGTRVEEKVKQGYRNAEERGNTTETKGKVRGHNSWAERRDRKGGESPLEEAGVNGLNAEGEEP